MNKGTTYNINATITDTAGNQSVASNSFTVSEDRHAPGAGDWSSVAGDAVLVTGGLTSGARTNDTDLAVTVSLSGTGALAGDTVQLRDGTSALGRDRKSVV